MTDCQTVETARQVIAIAKMTLAVREPDLVAAISQARRELNALWVVNHEESQGEGAESQADLVQLMRAFCEFRNLAANIDKRWKLGITTGVTHD